MKFKQRKPNSQIMTGVFVLASIALAGCSDPAEGVKEAEVAAPAGENPETAAVADAKTYTIRPDSVIGFTGSKITASHSGGFKTFTGKISVAEGNLAPPSSIEIDMNSTWSDSERLTLDPAFEKRRLLRRRDLSQLKVCPHRRRALRRLFTLHGSHERHPLSRNNLDHRRGSKPHVRVFHHVF